MQKGPLLAWASRWRDKDNNPGASLGCTGPHQQSAKFYTSFLVSHLLTITVGGYRTYLGEPSHLAVHGGGGTIHGLRGRGARRSGPPSHM